MYKLLFFIIFTFPTLTKAQSTYGTLTVKTTGYENVKGDVLVLLFKGGEGFPSDSAKAYRKIKEKLKGSEHYLYFDNLPQGNYALIVVHDENENGHADKNWMGIPKESVGISNYPKIERPQFETAKIKLEEAEQKEIIVKLNKIF